MVGEDDGPLPNPYMLSPWFMVFMFPIVSPTGGREEEEVVEVEGIAADDEADG